MRGLVVGRFQPLHNGHLHLLLQALRDCETVVVAIGSSTATPDLRNPFTYEERSQMVHAALGSILPAVQLEERIRIAAVPDLNDDARWVPHLLALTGPVDRIYGNDDRTLALFERAKFPIVRTGLLDRASFEGASIRNHVRDDHNWTSLVPAPVAALLKQWDAPQRLRRLSQ